MFTVLRAVSVCDRLSLGFHTHGVRLHMSLSPKLYLFILKAQRERFSLYTGTERSREESTSVFFLPLSKKRKTNLKCGWSSYSL